MISYHLTSNHGASDAKADLARIIDYLITFTGEIGVHKDSDTHATISYIDTPLAATLATTGDHNRQITLTCENNDQVSVGLIKNIIKNIDYRMFNHQTLSYMVNDPNILDLTVTPVEASIQEILKHYHLTPLFQYRESLVFYAKDARDRIHLVNRHVLEFFMKHPLTKKIPKLFSVVVARDLGRFVALMDRGLVPLSFYKYVYAPENIINLSGFNIDKMSQNVIIEQINFVLDIAKQTFVQTGSSQKEVKKGRSLVKSLAIKKYLAIKIAQDVRFTLDHQTLIPNIKVSVYFDA